LPTFTVPQALIFLPPTLIAPQLPPYSSTITLVLCNQGQNYHYNRVSLGIFQIFGGALRTLRGARRSSRIGAYSNKVIGPIGPPAIESLSEHSYI